MPELSVNGYHFSKTMTWLNFSGPEIRILQNKAVEKGVYVSVGIAEQDAHGKKWNTQRSDSKEFMLVYNVTISGVAR